MSAKNYLSALQRIRVRLPELAPAPSRTAAGGASAWDPILTFEMRARGVQIVEEHVVDDLLADLDASIGVERAMGERPSTSTHVREVGLLD